MLVPGMNHTEISREVFRDLPVILKRCAHLYPKWKKKMLKQNKTTDTREFFYRSAFKNAWQITMKLSVTDYEVVPISWFYNDKGFEAYLPLIDKQGWMMRYTSHFFNRYNERLKLGIVHPRDIVRHYFKNNAVNYIEELNKCNSNIYKVAYVQSEGLALGREYLNEQLFAVNTFLATRMLKGAKRNRYKTITDLCSQKKTTVTVLKNRIAA